MLPATADLTAYRGDTWAQTFALKRDGTPISLTGATCAASAKAPNGKVYALQTSLNTSTGEVTISFPSGAAPPAGKYTYDVEVTESGGNIVTWVAGQLNIQQDIANAP